MKIIKEWSWSPLLSLPSVYGCMPARPFTGDWCKGCMGDAGSRAEGVWRFLRRGELRKTDKRVGSILKGYGKDIERVFNQ